MSFSFTLTHTDGRARAGVVHTPHGDIETPVFMPVGTQATVKGVPPRDLLDLGSKLFSPTHITCICDRAMTWWRGAVACTGSCSWPKPILTDSGGFQVFSLSEMRKIDDEGVTFKSHLDGSMHRFTPEKAIKIQENLGADIIMCFDECPPPTDREYSELAMNRTHAWARRCHAAHTRPIRHCLASCKVASSASCARPRLDLLPGWTFRATPLAGWPWARAKPICSM